MIPMHSNLEEYLFNKRVVRYFHQIMSIYVEPQLYDKTIEFFGFKKYRDLIWRLDYFKQRTKTIIDSRYPIIIGVINDS